MTSKGYWTKERTIRGIMRETSGLQYSALLSEFLTEELPIDKTEHSKFEIIINFLLHSARDIIVGNEQRNGPTVDDAGEDKKFPLSKRVENIFASRRKEGVPAEEGWRSRRDTYSYRLANGTAVIRQQEFDECVDALEKILIDGESLVEEKTAFDCITQRLSKFFRLRNSKAILSTLLLEYIDNHKITELLDKEYVVLNERYFVEIVDEVVRDLWPPMSADDLVAIDDARHFLFDLNIIFVRAYPQYLFAYYCAREQYAILKKNLEAQKRHSAPYHIVGLASLHEDGTVTETFTKKELAEYADKLSYVTKLRSAAEKDQAAYELVLMHASASKKENKRVLRQATVLHNHVIPLLDTLHTSIVMEMLMTIQAQHKKEVVPRSEHSN